MKNENMVTLKDICDETRTVIEEGKECLAPAYFSSMKTMLQGAIAFVDFFIEIHSNQCVYCGNDPGDFLFDLSTGEMEFTGKSAILPIEQDVFGVKAGEDSRILMSEFLAPEILMALQEENDVIYTTDTDRYFMSVFLFEYFFHTGSPFEGKMMVNRCFLSPLEKELYRVEHGKFCMDPWDEENKPVKGIQDKLIRYWNIYPEGFGKMFQRAFLSGAVQANLRPADIEWKRIFISLMMDYKSCQCGNKGYSHQLQENENGTRQCPKCGKVYYPISDGLDWIWLAEGEKLYECRTGRKPFDYKTVTGIVVENKKQKGLYGIKNVGENTWQGMYPDQSTREITKGQVLPIWSNMMIRFEVGEQWTLRLKSQIEELQHEGMEEEHES